MYLLAGSAGIFLFAVFSFVVKKRLLVGLDFDTTVRIQGRIPLSFDEFLSFFSIMGSFEITIILLILFLVIKRKIAGVILIAFFGFAHVIELAGKYYLKHPGPPFMFFRYNLDFLFPTSYVQTGSSYPSGHSMRTVYLAVLFIYFIATHNKFPPIVRFLMCSFIVGFVGIMLVSRVSLGEHWSTDVIGGSILGVAFAFFSIAVLR